MSASDNSAPDIAEIKREIVRVVEDEIGRTGVAYVSDLGSRLGAAYRKQLKDLTGQSVGVFVEHELSATFQVARTGPHKNVVVLVKPGQDAEAAIRARQKNAGTGVSKRAFPPGLWLAFSTPPTASHRYLMLDPLGFVDSEDAAPPPNGHLIPLEFMRRAEDAYNADSVRANILKWMENTSIDGRQFEIAHAPAATQSQHARASLLDLLLSTLDRKQQQSVTLPLDVVAKLLRTHP